MSLYPESVVQSTYSVPQRSISFYCYLGLPSSQYFCRLSQTCKLTGDKTSDIWYTLYNSTSYIWYRNPVVSTFFFSLFLLYWWKCRKTKISNVLCYLAVTSNVNVKWNLLTLTLIKTAENLRGFLIRKYGKKVF